MKFHHIVEINDPLNPLIDPLSRDQVWRGLVLRAEDPKMFMPHLDEVELFDRSNDSVTRVLHFGTLQVRDTVLYFPKEKLEFKIPPQGEIPASNLTISIEEPGEGMLQVRFDYADEGSERTGTLDGFYDEFRHSAYKEADLDTIGLIRVLAEQGRLDQH